MSHTQTHSSDPGLNVRTRDCILTYLPRRLHHFPKKQYHPLFRIDFSFLLWSDIGGLGYFWGSPYLKCDQVCWDYLPNLLIFYRLKSCLSAWNDVYVKCLDVKILYLEWWILKCNSKCKKCMLSVFCKSSKILSRILSGECSASLMKFPPYLNLFRGKVSPSDHLIRRWLVSQQVRPVAAVTGVSSWTVIVSTCPWTHTFIREAGALSHYSIHWKRQGLKDAFAPDCYICLIMMMMKMMITFFNFLGLHCFNEK